MSNEYRQRGVTLVELIIAILVAGLMLGGIMAAYSNLVSRSADPMIMHQSVLTARSMMEEILLKAYLDPVTQTTCPAPNAGGRPAYDNVCDFNGYSSQPVVDQQGNSIPELAAYSVSVSVAPATGSSALGSIPSTRALRVQVTVNNPLARPINLVAWRTCYESDTCSSL